MAKYHGFAASKGLHQVDNMIPRQLDLHGQIRVPHADGTIDWLQQLYPHNCEEDTGA